MEGGDLKITGGTFNGVIWVMGNLEISGNAHINGAIFVDGNAEDTTEVAGTPNIDYDLSKIVAAFGSNIMPFDKTSWREFY